MMHDQESTAEAGDEDDDIQFCEACDARGPIESYTLMVDCWFCADCTAKWQAEFAGCKHEWISATNDFGEPSGYCTRCAGLVALESFPAMGFDLAAVKEGASDA